MNDVVYYVPVFYMHNQKLRKNDRSSKGKTVIANRTSVMCLKTMVYLKMMTRCGEEREGHVNHLAALTVQQLRGYYA